jgi:hypothetical protein
MYTTFVFTITTSFSFSLTYVLSGDTLSDNLGVLVDEHLWLSAGLVDSARSECQEARVVGGEL